MPLDDLKQFKAKVDRRLEQLYSEKSRAAAAIDPLYQELLADMGRFIARGGKRLRPYLIYLAYRGYGGQSDAVVDVAAGMELFHNFLLIHDDIMDRDLTRYGGPNLTGLYDQRFAQTMPPADARHFADAMAILAGDVNCGLGYELMLEADFGPERLLQVARRVHKMIFEVAGGQQLDVLVPVLQEPEISEERLLQVSYYKTSGYTFAAPLEIGAILAGADEAERKRIAEIAQPLGVAFQLRDDLLGMFANENVLGKSTLSDLREGKRTLLSQAAQSALKGVDLDKFNSMLGNPKVSYSQLGWARQVLTEAGVKQAIEDRARGYADQAAAAARKLKLTPEALEKLLELIDYTVRREL